jgi:hypothetical protein
MLTWSDKEYAKFRTALRSSSSENRRRLQDDECKKQSPPDEKGTRKQFKSKSEVQS